MVGPPFGDRTVSVKGALLTCPAASETRTTNAVPPAEPRDGVPLTTPPAEMLAQAGSPPDSVHTDATVTLRPVDGVPTITKIALVTVGRVPGIDEAAFVEHATAAKAGCPVALCTAHRIDPAVIADPQIFNIFCPNGCSTSWSEASQIPPANNVDRPGAVRREALHSGRNFS